MCYLMVGEEPQCATLMVGGGTLVCYFFKQFFYLLKHSRSARKCFWS